MIDFRDWMTLSRLSGDFMADAQSINCINMTQIVIVFWKEQYNDITVHIPAHKTDKPVWVL